MDEEKNQTTEHLDSKIKLIWSLNAIALLFIAWVVGSFAFVKLGIHFLGFDPNIAPVVLFIILLLISLPYFAWLELEYRAFRYGLSLTEMRIRKGVIKTETYVIPYEKIQNINVERSPIEKILELATLRIETAGSNVGESDILLPGVSNYKELVKKILNKVEKAKHAIEREESFEKDETEIIEKLTMMVSRVGNKINTIEERLDKMQAEIERIKKESIKRISPKRKKAKKSKGRKKGE